MSHGDMTKQDFENFSHMLHNCSLSTQEEEVSGLLWVWSQPDLYGTFQASPHSRVRLSQNNTTNKTLAMLHWNPTLHFLEVVYHPCEISLKKKLGVCFVNTI